MTEHGTVETSERLIGAALASIARLEAASERPARLTDPDHARWRRFARRLGWRDYIEVLFQDLESAFPTLFEVSTWRPALAAISDKNAELLIRRAAHPSDDAPDAFLRAQAEVLGLCNAGALSEVPALQPQHRILELPGASGRIAAYAVRRDSHLNLQDQLTFVVGSPAERVMLGLAVVEARANAPTVWTPAEAAEHAPSARFDRVLGFKAAPVPEWASALDGIVRI